MTPVFSPAQAQEHAVFVALMWALSRPGEVQTLEGTHGLEGIRVANSTVPSLESVGKALLDLETNFYTPDSHLHQQFVRLGAQAKTAQEAIYQFYPQLDESALLQLAQAPIGTLPHPETGATQVLGCELGNGLRLRLSGPGIQGLREIQVGGFPGDFWKLRDERVSFPLGWDLFLLSGNALIGIPRSTKVEVV